MTSYPVNHPAHYGGENNVYEAIRVIEAHNLNFNLGNATKYILRAGKKGPAKEDLEKAVWYLQREIGLINAKGVGGERRGPIDRETALRARPAVDVFKDGMTQMRRVLNDDALYLAMLWQVEGWIIGQRSWLQGVADARARERLDGNSKAAGNVISLPVVGAPADAQQQEQRVVAAEDRPAVGTG